MKNNNIEKTIINKAMKDFRPTKAFAKEHGQEINSIFYLGERLTPLQVELTKELIYAFQGLNKEVGKEKADAITEGVLSQVAMDMFLSSIMK